MLPELQPPQIINRGRGPEIAGTRITVYDVMDYRKHGWQTDRIAGLFSLSSTEIQAAFDYIDEHEEEVKREYEKILERHRNYKYPPDVQAKVDATRGLAKRKLEELRSNQKKNDDHAGDPIRS